MTNNTKSRIKSNTIKTARSNDQKKERQALSNEFEMSSSSSSSPPSSASSTSSSGAAVKGKSTTAEPNSVAPAGGSGEPSGAQQQHSKHHAHQHKQQPANLHITSQTYRIITQYGDMLVIKQSLHNSSHHHHHHHHHPHPLLHHHASLASATQSTASGHTATSMVSCAEVQQQPNRPIIMTFHDLGLNSELQFAPFFECHEVKLLLQTFTIMHVNFIGQEFEQNPATGMPQPCESLPEDFKYPTVEQLAECIVDVCAQMRIRSFVALAVGAGAHVVSTLALIRPDLVHGLFLINPVVASCSITEWLYFKMSAIASNHQTASQSAAAAAASSATSHANDAASSCSTSDQSTMDDDQPAGNTVAVRSQQQSTHSSSHHHHGESGLRRLLHAMHLPHKHHNQHHHRHHHHYHHHHHHSRTHHISSSKGHRTNDEIDNSNSNSNIASERVSDESGLAEMTRTTSISSTATEPAGSTPEPGATSATAAPSIAQPASSRLRQMILSRNFRMAGAQAAATKHKQQQQQSDQSSSGASDLASVSRKSSESPSSTSAVGRTSSRPNFHHAHHQQHPQHKRAPIEYLMYHHFGSSAFRRVRRPSDTPPSTSSAGHGAGESPSTGGGSSATGNDSSGGHPSPASRSLDSGNQRADSMSLHATTNTDSADGAAGPGAARPRYQRMRRSNSVCLSASYLASFSSERQRINYIQSVYKQYFNQINTHNLWLFAQSFAKRRALNLRKDCGAAAHAAAAAAALGTSICAAFIAAQPPPGGSGGATLSGGGGSGGGSNTAVATATQSRSTAAATSDAAMTTGATGAATGTGGGVSSATVGSESGITRLAAIATKHARDHSGGSPKANPLASGANSSNTQVAASSKQSISTNNNQLQQQQLQQQQHQQEQQTPLVAGTKVKRTFTCQTLIMCSSVQMHCERALKLMSLLNPLQATWIKIDHLLVLEERPDKVCQVLRLFLQGIGYSMSTYERRLRLNSAHASASSAESSSSIRSLNDKSGG